jgi:sugar phosphate isomerase/epimerase
MMGFMQTKIAITSRLAGEPDGVLGIACDPEGSRAVDFRIESDDLAGVLPAATELHRSAGCELEVRYHYPLRGREELSSADAVAANAALAEMRLVCDQLGALGARYLTVHLPLLGDAAAGQVANAKSRFAEVVGYGRERGITVCLENLRWGLTSDPEVFLDLADGAGAAVTLDVGHAASSDLAARGFTAEQFVRAAGARIRNAHVYEREDPHHIAPVTLDNVAAALGALLETRCEWWVVELFDAAEVRSTRSLLREFLGMHAQPRTSSLAS